MSFPSKAGLLLVTTFVLSVLAGGQVYRTTVDTSTDPDEVCIAGQCEAQQN